MTTTTIDDPAGPGPGPAAPRPAPEAPGAGRAGLRQAIGFEWTKLRSIRATVWTLVATGVMPPAFAVFVAATGSLQPDDTVLGGSLTGVVLVQLVAAGFGALVMTSEHTSGTIRTTLAAQPRRRTVMAAKAAVVGAVLLPVALASSAGAFALGLGLLDRDLYATGDPWPALLGVALLVTLSGLLGLAVGTVLRRSAGAVAALSGVMVLPSLFGPLFGDLQRWVGGAAPSGALQKLTQTSDATHEAVGSLGGWPSLAVVAAYTVLAVVVGGHLLRSRDA